MPSRFTNKKTVETVFLMYNGVNIISYAYIYVLRPLTNDLWVFIFQTIDAKYVK